MQFQGISEDSPVRDSSLPTEKQLVHKCLCRVVPSSWPTVQYLPMDQHRFPTEFSRKADLVYPETSSQLRSYTLCQTTKPSLETP